MSALATPNESVVPRRVGCHAPQIPGPTRPALRLGLEPIVVPGDRRHPVKPSAVEVPATGRSRGAPQGRPFGAGGLEAALAALTGDPAVSVSGRTGRQGAPGAAPVAAMVRA